MLVLCFDWIRSSGSSRVFFDSWFDIGSECTVLQVDTGRGNEKNERMLGFTFFELLLKLAVKNQLYQTVFYWQLQLSIRIFLSKSQTTL